MAQHHLRSNPMIRTARTATAETFLADLYREISESRTTVIERALADARSMPEAPAETLTLAAAALAHMNGVPSQTTGRAATVARRLTAEARRLDPRAGALAEDWLTELEQAEPVAEKELLQECADSLAWAAATLRHMARLLEDTEDGNAEQAELAWLCLEEAAVLLMAADHVAIDDERGAEV
jgi:hypothetical protein